MDIRAFLASGTTHIHTKEPLGNFAKAAAGFVLALSLGVSAPASAQEVNLSEAKSVAEMPYASDAVSLFYQALVAPQIGSNTRIVSTHSGAVLSLLQSMPSTMLETLNTTPDHIYSASQTSAMGFAPQAMTLLEKPSYLSEKQSVCIVSAMESVGANTLYKAGVPYINIPGLTNAGGDTASQLSNMTVTEAAMVVTLHELSHCVWHAKSSTSAEQDQGAMKADQMFSTAFAETAADLAVVLYYASQEGHFDNGRLAVGAIRAQFMNGDHSTIDMLDHVLSGLDAGNFKGMNVNDIFQKVPEIMDAIWAEDHSQMRRIFMRDLFEGDYLKAKVSGNEKNIEQLQGSVAEHFRTIEPNFSYNPYAKAHKIIDQLLDHGLRNPDFHRQLDSISVVGLEKLADQMGVQLTPNQVIKARFLDPEFSPPGTKGEPGVAGVGKLREVNYYSQLEDQAVKNLAPLVKSLQSFR